MRLSRSLDSQLPQEPGRCDAGETSTLQVCGGDLHQGPGRYDVALRVLSVEGPCRIRWDSDAEPQIRVDRRNIVDQGVS